MMRSSRYRRWHLDKIFVKINEVEHDLGRAVDQAGEFLEMTCRRGNVTSFLA
jgi:transposase-like protein